MACHTYSESKGIRFPDCVLGFFGKKFLLFGQLRDVGPLLLQSASKSYLPRRRSRAGE